MIQSVAEQLDQQLVEANRKRYRLLVENMALKEQREELRIACQALIEAHRIGDFYEWVTARRLANEALRKSEPTK